VTAYGDAVNPTLHTVLLELSDQVAAEGWGQPPRLFALVLTADLQREDPTFAAQLGLAQVDPTVAPWTALEDDFGNAMLEEVAWPPGVSGCALAVERLTLPPAAEAGMPADPDAAAQWVAEHPDRQEIRLVACMLRDGSRDASVRFRAHDSVQDMLFGPDLISADLADVLLSTFAE
jgi:hypothetical protein